MHADIGGPQCQAREHSPSYTAIMARKWQRKGRRHVLQLRLPGQGWLLQHALVTWHHTLPVEPGEGLEHLASCTGPAVGSYTSQPCSATGWRAFWGCQPLLHRLSHFQVGFFITLIYYSQSCPASVPASELPLPFSDEGGTLETTSFS